MVKVSQSLKELAAIFGGELYIVGGYVRNSLLNFPTSDVDLAAKLSPEEVRERLSGTKFLVKTTSEKLFTLKIICGIESYEYTTFRTDSYSIGHTPASAAPTLDIKIDALRRDFKMNAVYYDITKEKIADPLSGVEDIKNKIISTTREGEEVFSEDGLRLMRLARMSAELNFDVEEETLTAAKKYAAKIKEISKERIRDELDKILVADTAYKIADAHYRGLKLLTEIGIMNYILPELTLGLGMQQRKDFHKYDVFEHTLMTVKYSSKEIRLAALLHDIGKPKCYLQSGRYVGHDKEGYTLTEEVLTRLKYPVKVINETKRLVLNHMFDLKMEAKENTIRLFIQKNYDIFDKLCDLKQADYLGSGIMDGISPSVINFKKIYRDMIEEGVPFTIGDLKVTGNDLIQAGIPPQKRGEVLNNLLKDSAMIDSKLVSYEEQKKYLERIKDRG